MGEAGVSRTSQLLRAHRFRGLCRVGRAVCDSRPRLDRPRQTYTWDPNGTLTDSSGTWTAGAGTWYDGSADTTWTDDGAAAFGWNPGGTASYTVTLGSAVSPTGLIFNNEKYTINLDAGNLYGLTIGASGITDNAAGTTAINAPVTLGTAQTWTIASGSTLAVGGNVSGIPLAPSPWPAAAH